MKFQSIPSLILFTLTDDPEVLGLEVFLSNTLMIGLFRSNNRMVIFFLKQKKNSYHSKHVRDHTFMTSIWKVDVHIKGGVLKFVTCLYILFFLNKDLLCSFLLADEGGGGHKIGHFLLSS